jgi:hypothetical protein
MSEAASYMAKVADQRRRGLAPRHDGEAGANKDRTNAEPDPNVAAEWAEYGIDEAAYRSYMHAGALL